MAQGSFLGPLLLTLYVNNMSPAFKCALRHYNDDDSILLVSGKSVHQVEQTLEKEINDISKWLQAIIRYLYILEKRIIFCLILFVN